MGCGSSRTPVQTFDKANQVPSIPSPPSPIPPGKSSVFEPIRPKPSVPNGTFHFDSNIEEYSSVWDQDAKLSSNFRQSIQKHESHVEHHQKETLTNKRSTKSSAITDSAHIESTIETETHACMNISSSEKIDDLMKNLTGIHTELDDIIKRRTEQISQETQSILFHIQTETQAKQQQLLNYAKDQQLKNDEHYRKLLQDYLAQIDQIKAQDLANLQKQLENYREKIFEESQLKIVTVNDQANLTKSKILREEQQKAATKIDSTVAQLNQLFNDDQLQHLGSESISRTEIISNAHVGTKASGQHCQFNFDQINPPESTNNRKSKK